jgi:hypothetical protein
MVIAEAFYTSRCVLTQQLISASSSDEEDFSEEWHIVIGR